MKTGVILYGGSGFLESHLADALSPFWYLELP